jgi:hypothetical protein
LLDVQGVLAGPLSRDVDVLSQQRETGMRSRSITRPTTSGPMLLRTITRSPGSSLIRQNLLPERSWSARASRSAAGALWLSRSLDLPRWRRSQTRASIPPFDGGPVAETVSTAMPPPIGGSSVLVIAHTDHPAGDVPMETNSASSTLPASFTYPNTVSAAKTATTMARSYCEKAILRFCGEVR